MTEEASVLLIDPKHPHNVGNALRACALLGAQTLGWTGDRVDAPEKWPKGTRLPREERMKCYAATAMEHYPDASNLLRWIEGDTWTPVCVEITDGAEDLRKFVHPARPVYVFGPEDGGVPKAVRGLCHRFVRIPVWEDDERTPYNLAAAVNIVLFDRLVKRDHDERVRELVEHRYQRTL